MRCTVNKLAKISGVSVRTLHWYDKIGLLKPAFLEANGYRYYEEEQLLQLQQILFFRELGFPLKDIQKMLTSNEFDQVKALREHKQILQGNIDRMGKLTDTIDKTIQHLEGKQSMKQEELYYGFDKKLPKSDQYVCVAKGTPAENMLAHFKKDEVVWTDQQWANFKNKVDLLDKAIAQQILQGAKPDSSEVQKLIQEHYDGQANFFNLTEEAYSALIQMYEDDSGTIKMFFEAYHPEMQKFMCKAMRYYAKMNLQ